MKQLLIDWYEGLYLWSLKNSDPDLWLQQVLRLLLFIVHIFSQILISGFLVKITKLSYISIPPGVIVVAVGTGVLVSFFGGIYTYEKHHDLFREYTQEEISRKRKTALLCSGILIFGFVLGLVLLLSSRRPVRLWG